MVHDPGIVLVCGYQVVAIQSGRVLTGIHCERHRDVGRYQSPYARYGGGAVIAQCAVGKRSVHWSFQESSLGTPAAHIACDIRHRGQGCYTPAGDDGRVGIHERPGSGSSGNHIIGPGRAHQVGRVARRCIGPAIILGLFIAVGIVGHGPGCARTLASLISHDREIGLGGDIVRR